MKIPFNRPFIVGRELEYIREAVEGGQLAGDGRFTERCQAWMQTRFDIEKVLLTTSCTMALEMSAILCDIQPGDEVILPSYTFVTTANAFVLLGATPVFADIDPETLNIAPADIEARITERTKAIVPVHYAGVGCDMDAICAIAQKHGLRVVEDAAQGVNARYKDRYLGSIGDLGCFSFHETKNFIAGEGGAITINDPSLIERAEIIREKGTNRSKFFRGEVDKYTWVDIGSSFLPSELIAAYLFAQLEEADRITEKRLAIFDRYRAGLQSLEDAGTLRLPIIPAHCEHNGHMFYLILESTEQRADLIAHLKRLDILSVFHYVPLHTSPMGQRYGCRAGDLPVTEDLSERLLRLPCYFELSPEQQDTVIAAVHDFFR
ncbi:MAG: dTDP-4-amino-4,6-dideoxygalactose transaminase [Kiritimatiellia bacterium]|jgi:dTDP-4-amino-4,6-dideoxygalactose transaminase